jgi:hypothetical protein
LTTASSNASRRISSTPPAGSPGYFYTFKDNSFHGGADRIEVFELDVNFATPATSTFVMTTNIPIAAYTYTVCGFFNFNCIPQLGTSQRLDPVSEWPMHRFPYRNFGSHQALVGNFTVGLGSGRDQRGAIRWFEPATLAAVDPPSSGRRPADGHIGSWEHRHDGATSPWAIRLEPTMRPVSGMPLSPGDPPAR